MRVVLLIETVDSKCAKSRAGMLGAGLAIARKGSDEPDSQWDSADRELSKHAKLLANALKPKFAMSRTDGEDKAPDLSVPTTKTEEPGQLGLRRGSEDPPSR